VKTGQKGGDCDVLGQANATDTFIFDQADSTGEGKKGEKKKNGPSVKVIK